jgi:membrane associated rhomboid family serine protease
MTPWVRRLLLANVVVFLVIPFGSPVYRMLTFVPALILERPWGLLTYMFLHGNFMHILFNMIGLFFFGPRLESRIGSRDFIRMYLLAGLAGALLHLAVGFGGAFVDMPFDPRIGLVGASGAVFGVLYGFAHYWPHERIYIWGVLPIPSRVMVIALAGISIYSGFTGAGAGIAHFAHLGGFVGGWGYLKIRERRSEAFRRRATPGAEPTAIDRISGRAARDEKRWESIRIETLHEINRQEVERIRLANELAARYGDAAAVTACRASDESVRAIGEWCAINGVDAWYRPAPYLEVASSPAQEISAPVPRKSNRVPSSRDACWRALSTS